MRLLLVWLLLLCAAVAEAGEAALDVERARAALALDRTDEALDLAGRAVAAEPTEWLTHRTYLAASERAGLLAAAEAELAELRTEDPVAAMVWAWWRVRRGELPLAELERAAARVPDSGQTALAWVAAGHLDTEQARRLLPDHRGPSVAWLSLRLDLMEGRDRHAARQARRWYRAHPDRPEVLEELWTRHHGEESGRLERARRRALRQVSRQLAKRQDDPLFLYRALRVFLAGGDSAAARQVAQQIQASGDPRPLHHNPWSRPMQEAMGHTLARTSAPQLPHGAPEELAQIVAATQRYALERGQPEVALQVREALAARTQRWQDWMDLGALIQQEQPDGDAQRVAATHALHAAVRGASDDLGRLDTPRQRAEVAGALRAWLEAEPGAQGALEQAVQGLVRRLEGGGEALPEGALGRVEEGLGVEWQPGAVEAVIASLIAPQDGAAWASRALALEGLGEPRGAFTAFAVARSLGQPVDGDLERTYRGLARPEPVASALAAVWADGMEAVGWLRPAEVSVEAAEGVEAVEGEVLGIVQEASAPPVGPPRPRVGRPMPAWEAMDPQGEALRAEALAGEVYVLAVWATWCAPCRVELPELHEAIEEVVAEGRAVRGIAVSVDERERVWRRVQGRGGWESLEPAWAPELSARLRIPELPATFVVAADGTLVHHQVGYDPAFGGKLAELLRKHAR